MVAAQNGVARSYERVDGWGLAVGAPSAVLRPTTVDGIRAAFDVARREHTTLGLRGAGCSYGDASVNQGGHVLDLTRMRRMISFDRATGVAVLEPGATIEQLWKHALPLGYWPRYERPYAAYGRRYWAPRRWGRGCCGPRAVYAVPPPMPVPVIK